jgi:hypothetical protein
LITLIIFGEEHKLFSFSSWNFLDPHVTSSLSVSNILLSSLLSNTLNLCSSLNVKDQSFFDENNVYFTALSRACCFPPPISSI